MLRMNIEMEEKLKQESENLQNKDLSDKLLKIIDEGFFFSKGMIFFKKNLHSVLTDSFVNGVLKDRYHDYSGFEKSTNKINIDDFVDKDVFIQGILFFKYFKNTWIKLGHPSCNIIFSYEIHEEFGSLGKFTFYLERDNEEVININNLNEYKREAIFFEKI